MSFQIKLYEGSNNIEFVFAAFTASATANPGFKTAGTGIKGTSNSVGNIVFVRKGSTTAWSAATFGNSGVTTQIFNIRNNAQPDVGRTYRFTAALPNDARINALYTQGKVPIPNNATRTDSVSVGNIGLNVLTNVNVTLTISGANTFTDTKVIPSLALAANANVVFAPYTLINEGNNTYNVTISNDDNNVNNSSTITQVVNKNTWSYAYGSVADGGVGFNGNTGDFVAKFNTNAATAITQVSANFFLGGQPYQIGIWDASGVGGTPGAVLYTSPTYTSITGVNTQPIFPTVNIPVGNYYVGIKQTGTVNVSFAYQTETPIRAQNFYFTSPGGGTAWTDFAPANSFRFMIEPKLISATDASLTNAVVPQIVTCFSTPQTISATLVNSGLNPIAPGAAMVTLKVRGANVFTGNVSNSNSIVSGGSEVISFTGIDLSIPGTNFDTLYVSLPSDDEKANDTLKLSNTSGSTINSFPAIENVEASLPVFGYVATVSGTRNLWGVRTTPYTNTDQTLALNAHGGTRFIIADNYSGSSSVGFNSRLYSNCLSLPTGSCPKELSFWMSHDNTTAVTELDSLYVSISTDKGLTWTRVNIDAVAGLQRHDPSLTANAAPIWRQSFVDLASYAGQTIQIGFEAVSKYGNAFGLDDIEIRTLATDNVAVTTTTGAVTLTSVCDEAGWTYYVDPVTSKNVLSIEWGTNAASKAAAVATVSLDATNYSATSGSGSTAMGTFTMKRYWNVDVSGTQPTTPVNVRFFYDVAEKTATDNDAIAFQTANAGSTLESPTWFKTVGLNFAPNATNISSIGVNSADPLVDVNAGAALKINNVLYAQFNGITSFSGGSYSAGVGLGTPLPVTITNIKAEITGATNTVTWTTATESNNRKFVIERSTNGVNYSPIGEVATRAINGNSAGALSYNFVDANPVQGKQYYRLQMVDNGGQTKYSQIVTLRRGSGKLEIVDVHPNPTTSLVYFNVLGVGNNVNIAVRNLSGKKIIRKGLVQSNSFSIDMSKLVNGMYILEVIDVRNGENAMFKVMKQ